MKKSLFALAAVTAFAGAAQAQSSVTVYGILDVGFSGATAKAGTTAAGNGSPTVNTTGFTGGGSQQTSRLGFRGNEDLGGGTAAFFTSEFGLSPTDATLSGNVNSGLFNRQTFVGLSQKGVGQFAIGTQYTPIHTAVGRTDPGQQNNIAGNVIYSVSSATGASETTNAYTVRLNQALTLQSDRMAGFQINALYNNSNSSATALTSEAQPGLPSGNNIAYGAGINYVLQKFNLDLAYLNLKNTTLNQNGSMQAAAAPSIVNAVSKAGVWTVVNPFGTNVGQTQMYAGAVYDFGILKAYAQFIDSKAVSNLDSNVYAQRVAQQIGVRGNFNPKIEGWASVGNGRATAGASQGIASPNATQNFTGYQVGANYILSKRTNAYAIFGSSQVTSTSINASESRASYGVGVRHTF